MLQNDERDYISFAHQWNDFSAFEDKTIDLNVKLLRLSYFSLIKDEWRRLILFCGEWIFFVGRILKNLKREGKISWTKFVLREKAEVKRLIY